MKITKDENGKIVLDGEGTTMIFPKHDEKWLVTEGIDESMIQITNMYIVYSGTGGAGKLDKVSNFFSTLEL